MNAPNRALLAALAIFVGIALVLFVLDSTGNLGGLFGFLRDPAAATANLTAEPAQSVSSALSGPRNLQDAVSQIESLEQRLAEVERENEELREMQREFQVLSELFDYAVETPENQRLLANVIGRDSNPLFQSLIIDKGTNDGLRIGMPVDSPRGMVGQIFRVNSNSAMVLLITDSASGIPARLSSSRTIGLLQGGGLGEEMSMDWIPLEDEVNVGDVVITSGLVGEFEQGLMVGRFPKGLVLGRVTDVQRSEAEILQRAEVQTAVDFDELETVFVITEFQQIDLTDFADPLGEEEP